MKLVRAICVLSLLLAAIPAFGQSATATLNGVVKDESGGVMPGVTITVTGVETGWTTNTTTTNLGVYTITAIPPGSYRIKAELQGFAPSTREGVTLYVGQTASADLVLTVGGVADSVTVNADVALVNLTKSEIGQVVESKKIANLPLDSRDFLQLASLAPGVGPSAGFGGGSTSISALSFRNVAFNLDGFDYSDIIARGAAGTLSTEPIREFRVITNRFSAEYGGSMSGVVNAVTKSGTNEFHGAAYIYGRDEKLDAAQWVFDSASLTMKPETEKQPFSQLQAGFSLGGPIRQNTTHFYANYERDAYNGTLYVTADPAWVAPKFDISAEVGTFPQEIRDQQFLAKVSHLFSSRHSLEATGVFRVSTGTNWYVGGFSTLNFGAHTKAPEQQLLLTDRIVLSNHTVNEARFQYSRRHDDWIPNSTNPAIYDYTDSAVVYCCGSHPSVDQLNFSRRFQLRDDLTLTRGKHDLKGGVELQLIQGDSDTRYGKSGYFVIWYGSDLYFRQAFGQSAYTFNEELYAGYLQDDWKPLPNLTLNLGLRYDYNTLTPSDKNNASPRIGFAYNLGRDGKTNVRGGAGLYYDLNFTQILQTEKALGPDGMYTLTFGPSSALYPPDYTQAIDTLPPGVPPARDIYVLQPGIPTAHSVQASLGVARQVAADLAISVDGVYVAGHDLLRTRDLNAPVWHGPYPPGLETVYANTYRPTIPVPGGFRKIDQMEGTGISKYKGLLFNVTKRMSHRYSFEVSYTLADAKDDTGYGGDYVSRPNDSNNMNAEWGPAGNMIRHMLAANGMVELPAGFAFGGIFMAYSSRPYTPQLGYDYNGDGNTNDRPEGVGKNSLWGAPFKKLDLFVNKVFTFGSRYHVKLEMSAFNVLNNLNVTDFGNIVETDTYQIATTAYAPRQLQLSARFSF